MSTNLCCANSFFSGASILKKMRFNQFWMQTAPRALSKGRRQQLKSGGERIVRQLSALQLANVVPPSSEWAYSANAGATMTTLSKKHVDQLRALCRGMGHSRRISVSLNYCMNLRCVSSDSLTISNCFRAFLRFFAGNAVKAPSSLCKDDLLLMLWRKAATTGGVLSEPVEPKKRSTSKKRKKKGNREAITRPSQKRVRRDIRL